MGTELPRGTILGGYRIEALLGKGAMGAVHRANQLSLRRDVALKVLIAGAGAAPEERARFKREVELLTKLDHPHLIRVVDAGEEGETQYLVMELVDGGSLDGLVETQGPLGFDQGTRLVVSLASALEYLHQRGILHRDVKPANVLLTKNGEPKLADFGLARADHSTMMTQANQIVGTPLYLAPEIMLGKPASQASDIYALGVLAHRIFTTRYPFEGESLNEYMKTVLGGSPAQLGVHRDGVPARLEALILEMLARDPAARPTAAAIIQTLSARPSASGTFRRPGPITPPPRTPPPPVIRSRSPALAAVSTLLMVAGFLTTRLLSHKPPPPVATTSPSSVAVEGPSLEESRASLERTLSTFERTVAALTSFSANFLSWNNKEESLLLKNVTEIRMAFDDTRMALDQRLEAWQPRHMFDLASVLMRVLDQLVRHDVVEPVGRTTKTVLPRSGGPLRPSLDRLTDTLGNAASALGGGLLAAAIRAHLKPPDTELVKVSYHRAAARGCRAVTKRDPGAGAPPAELAAVRIALLVHALHHFHCWVEDVRDSGPIGDHADWDDTIVALRQELEGLRAALPPGEPPAWWTRVLQAGEECDQREAVMRQSVPNLKAPGGEPLPPRAEPPR